MRWRLQGRRGLRDGGDAELDARLSESWHAAAVAVERWLDLRASEEALLAKPGLSRVQTADLEAPDGMSRRVARRRRGGG
ncbi:MAG TPA: hypothetical protein VGI58_04965 [Streptosporangiaceae bacterium]